MTRFLRAATGVFLAVHGVMALAAPPPLTCPTISLAPTSLPNGDLATAYTPTVTSSGGAAPVVMDITHGVLPTGVSLTDNGDGTATFSGTSTQAGAFEFTITATDTNGCSGGRTYATSFAAATQTISFTSTAPAGATVGGPTYNVTATATSGLPVAFTIDATASAVCTIAGSTVSFIGVGTCVIDANQAGNASYSPAPQVQQSFGVAQGSQTITFTSTAPAAATVGGATYTATATASSGLPVTLTIDASASAVCSISGSTVSFTGVGTCVIDANQAGDANYTPATQVQQSFAVGQGSQTITFTSTAPAAATVGGPTYTVTATGGASGNPVTFTIDATATTVCSIAGSTVSFTAAGTCVIDANQAGNANYTAATQVQQSFAVGKGAQTITFTSTAPAGAIVGGPSYTVTATASSGLAVALTIDASASAVCSISGSTVSFLGVGTCVIDANQAGNANYNAAPQVQQSFAVGKGNQTITFTSTAPVGATVGGPTYTVIATASSGLVVNLTIDASASAVCSISGSAVSFIGAGTCVIDANQAGNANYNAAPQAQQSFAVGKGSQTITFTSTAPAGATFGGATYTVTATASSGLVVAFTIDAAAASVCSISGSTVSFIGAGTCVIDANQAGNANYNAAPQAQQSFAVAKADQTITFTSTPPATPTVGGPTYTVTATATSGLAVTFTIDASATSFCSISGSTVSFTAVGMCVIDANQAGNANYNAAPQIQQSFQVDQAPAITSANNTTFAPGKAGQTFTVTTTGFPTGASMSITQSGTVPSAVTFTNNNNGTATIAGTPAAGTQGSSPYAWTITANNGVAPNANQSFTFNVVCPVITVSGVIPALTFNTAMASATFSQVGGNGAIVWSATGLPAGVGINSGTGAVTGTPSVTGTFSATITATDAGGCTGSKSQSVTVAPVAVADAESGLVDNTQFVLTGGTTASPATPFVGAAGSITTNDLPSGGVTATAGTFATTAGGSVTLAADGTFIYTPKANAGAAAITSDSFTYTVFSNTGGGAAVTSAPGTVSLTLAGRVWYVKNNGAAGNGQSQSSFNTLAAGIAASTANDTIYIYTGDGTTTNLATASILKAGQKFIGQGVAFPFAGVTNAPAAGGFPIIGNTITLASNVTVNGIDMTTGGANGIVGSSATGLNVTVRNLTATTGTAVSLTNSDGTFIFTKVSAAGGANGIVWNNSAGSGATGSLTINGDGANTSVGGNSSGGTLSGMSGANGAVAGSAIYLSKVKNVTLRRMTINGTNANFGIRGFQVDGFTLEYSTVGGTNGGNFNTLPDDSGEGSIYFGNTVTNGLSTQGTFTNDNISGGAWDNLHVENTTAGTTALTVKGNTFGLNGPLPNGNQSFIVEARNAGTIINSVVGGPAAGEANTFLGAPGGLANFTGQTGTTMDVQFKNNVMSNSHPNNNVGGGNLTLATEGVMTFVADSNTMQGADGSAVTLQKASTGVPATDALTSLTGKFTNNTVGVTGVAASASKSGNGLFLSAAGAGTIGLTITGNQIRDWKGNAAMFFDNTGGSYTANFTITGNTMAEPGTGSFGSMAITNGGNLTSDTVNVCATIGGSTVALKNTITGTAALMDLYLGSSGQNGGHTFNLPGYAGASNLVNVQNFVTGNNTFSGGAAVSAYDDNGGQGSFTGVGASCPTP